MKLYQTYTSPFPTRVRLVLYAKGLTPEIIEPPGFHATTESKGDYFTINPIGRVPALVTDDGRALPESEVICEYLEDAYPDPPTLPPDPWGRAQVRLISRLCDFYLVMAMRPLFTASGMSRRRWDRARDRPGARRGGGRARLHRALHRRGGLRGRRAADLGRRGADPAADAEPTSGRRRCSRSPSPLGKHPKLAAYWAAIVRDPIAARLLQETRDAVAHEQQRARELARSRPA